MPYLTDAPIDVAALLSEARSGDGALCLFVGEITETQDTETGHTTLLVEHLLSNISKETLLRDLGHRHAALCGDALHLVHDALVARLAQEIAQPLALGSQPFFKCRIADPCVGQEFAAINGGPQFHHTAASSLLIWCDSQAEFEFTLDLLLDGLDRART